MLGKLSLFSPAKINLFLRILSRRDDGFHVLATLMHAIDLGDTLVFNLSPTDRFECSSPFPLPMDETNLVLKAFKLFRSRTGVKDSLSIELRKMIPIEAGLGGGSGNVATTLWGLNQLFKTQISEPTLREWAGEISKDAPFFFSSGCAYCTNAGESVESFAPMVYKKPLWLVKPLGGLSTAKIFQTLDMKSCSLISPTQLKWQALYGEHLPVNDLESVAFQLEPTLLQVKKKLESSNRRVWMTGSGTGLICESDDQPLLKEENVTRIRLIGRNAPNWYSGLNFR